MKLKTILWIGILLTYQTNAWAGIVVFPTRVALSDKKRVGFLTLKSDDKKPTTYQITTTFFKMRPNFTLKEIDKLDGTERSAMELIHYSPRIITMNPGEQQVFRVISYLKHELPSGEYRAHLKFTPLASNGDDPDDPRNKTKSTKEVQVKINLLTAVAVPVFLEHGQISRALNIEDLHFLQKNEDEQVLTMDWVNTGNGVLRGDFRVQWTNPDGDTEQVGQITKTAVYEGRTHIELPIKLPKKYTSGKVPIKGKFKVQYFDKQDEAEEEKLLSEVSLNLS